MGPAKPDAAERRAVIYIEEAIAVLLANKIRSLLTITGLIIGVAAVIAIQVLGGSMAGALDGLLGGMSDNSFMMFPNTQQRNVTAATIKLSDLAAVRTSVPGINAAIPLGSVQELVRHGHNAARYSLSPEASIPYDNLPAAYGRHIDQADVDDAANVVVLKNDAYVRLFPEGGDPTGAEHLCRAEPLRHRGRAPAAEARIAERLVRRLQSRCRGRRTSRDTSTATTSSARDSS